MTSTIIASSEKAFPQGILAALYDLFDFSMCVKVVLHVPFPEKIELRLHGFTS